MSVVEEWRPVPGWDGYEVSDQGRVLSRRRRRPAVLKPWTTPKGYQFVRLCRPGETKSKGVHRLVMLAFVGPRPDGLEIRHLDGDSTNNALTNLTYGTHSANVKDSVLHGTHTSLKPRCRLNHLMAGANLLHDEGGNVWCRKCTDLYEAMQRRRGAAGATA